ncbi:MAG: DUF721 domain-containing protein [Nitrospirae bacterium]|nr:DUF721 domain-containing protein [Nitrospirota bacterium]
MPENTFAQLAQRFLSNWGLRDRAFEQKLVAQWPDAVGPFLAGLTMPTGFKKGFLYLAVNNSVLLHELFYQKPQMLEKVQSYFGTAIRDIKFSLRPRFLETPPAGKPKATGPAPLSPEERASTLRITEGIADDELRSSLVNLFANSKRRLAARKR